MIDNIFHTALVFMIASSLLMAVAYIRRINKGLDLLDVVFVISWSMFILYGLKRIWL